MNANLLLQPPVAFGLFFLLLIFVHWISLKKSAKGKDHAEKYLPYSSGQNLPPAEVQLSYQEFFRLGLLFGLVHVTALVLSLSPIRLGVSQIGIFYLFGISVSAFVLVRDHGKKDGN
jgi:NADH:ubiquinone oxidoreductase subunit 3 (subunit A)